MPEKTPERGRRRVPRTWFQPFVCQMPQIGINIPCFQMVKAFLRIIEKSNDIQCIIILLFCGVGIHRMEEKEDDAFVGQEIRLKRNVLCDIS